MVRISRKFLKSTAMYTIAGALPMASAIILLPFYLLYLPLEEYGALSIYLAVSVLIQIITTYSFDTGLYVFYHDLKKEPGKLRRYISSVFIFIFLLGIAVALISLLLGDFVFSAFLKDKPIEFFPFGFMAVLSGIFQSFFKVHSNFLQTSENPGVFFWSNLLSFSLIAGLTILGLELYPQSLWGPIGGRLAASIVSAIWACGRIFINYGFRFDFSTLRESFRFNHSSFVYQLQQWSMNYFDRFIMLFFLPLETIGAYDFAVKCMLGLEFIISGLYNSFYPKVIHMVTNQEQKVSTPEINRYYHGFIAVIMVLVSLAILGFSIIIDLGWISAGYEQSVKYLPLIGVIYLIRSIRFFFAFPYGALKFSKPLPVIYLIISVLKILLIVFFVRDYGVISVIVAGILVTILEIILLWYFIRNKFEFRFNKLKIIVAPTVLATTIAIFQALDFLNSYVVYLFYLMVCFCVLALLYRSELKVLRPGNILR